MIIHYVFRPYRKINCESDLYRDWGIKSLGLIWEICLEKILGNIHPYILPIQNCNGVAGGGKNFWRKNFYGVGKFGGKFHDQNRK